MICANHINLRHLRSIMSDAYPNVEDII